MIAPIEDLLTFAGIEDVDLPCDCRDDRPARWTVACLHCDFRGLICQRHFEAALHYGADREARGILIYCALCDHAEHKHADLFAYSPINQRPTERR